MHNHMLLGVEGRLESLRDSRNIVRRNGPVVAVG
jgi:hypothetical protein